MDAAFVGQRLERCRVRTSKRAQANFQEVGGVEGVARRDSSLTLRERLCIAPKKNVPSKSDVVGGE